MFMRVGSSLLLVAVLSLSSSVGQAKAFAKIDTLAKRLLHRATNSGVVLNSRQAIIGAVGIVAVSCGNIACEKIQQPMTDVFAQSGDPSVGFNIDHYNRWSAIGESYHAYSVEHTDPSGTITSDAEIPINFHSRLASFGDFRLSIGDGPYRNNIYGVASSGGSFTIHDAQRAGSSIGSGVRASDRTTLTLNVDSNVTIVAGIHDPQLDTANDAITRAINITITDSRPNETETTIYSASTNWEYTISSGLITSPLSVSMPSYQRLAEKLNTLGATASRALHDIIRENDSINVYTATNVSGRSNRGFFRCES